MSKSALNYLFVKLPSAMIVTNYFTLDADLVDGSNIEVVINGASAKADFDTDTQTTLTKIKDMLLVYPFITDVTYSSGLAMTVTINTSKYADIDIVVNLLDTTSIATVAELDTYARETYLELAQQMTSKAWYKVNYEYAVALGACHLIALQALNSGTTGSGGQVASLQQGDLVVSYYQTGTDALSNQTDLARTPYGLELLSLRRRSNMAFGTTGYGGFFL